MIDEQPPAQSDNGTPASAPAADTRAARPPARQRGGCFGRLLAALLVVIITTFLALVAGAAGLLYLGATPAMPRQLAESQMQLATLQAQNSVLQTQVASGDQRGTTDHEILGDLKRQVDDIAGLRDQLRQERDNSAVQSATLVAEVRSGRDAVALFATAEAGRAALLADLDRRSARVERFLQRLGDIANDTALDLADTTPAPTPAPTEILASPPPLTPASIISETATAVPTTTVTPAATVAPPRATATVSRPTSTPIASSNATATPTLGR